MEIDDLVINGQHIDWTLQDPSLGGYSVRLRADNIKKEATGIHAHVFIGYNNALADHSTFNIERSEQRLRLVNAAYKLFPESLRQLYSVNQLKHDLDLFSLHAWPKYVGEMVPNLVVGFTERSLPEFVLDPYIVQGGGTILFGPPERMKTMTALTMAICVDAGLSEPFHVKDRSPVLYVNLERPDHSMQRRLGDINRAVGLQPDRPILMMNARGRSLSDIEEAISTAVQKEGVRVGFLDSISRAGYGDLIDNRVANQTIDILNRLFESWVGIAHSPRNDATHMFGSMHFEAGADIIVQLLTEYDENRIGVGLQVTKSNDMARPALRTVGYEFDDYGVARIWKPTSRDFPEIMAVNATRGGLQSEVKQYLLGVGAAHADEISKAISRSRGSVAKLLSASGQFIEVEREGHKILYGVVQ